MGVAQIQQATEASDALPHDADDPLLDCLHVITRLHGRPVSTAALVAGMPLEEGKLTPSLFIRAAERHGLRKDA